MAVLALDAQATASTGAPSSFISAWPQYWNQIECHTTPGPYRQGNTRRQVGQGASLAATADSLVQRQVVGRETGDGKQRQENTGR
jgi:hypothetical protein